MGAHGSGFLWCSLAVRGLLSSEDVGFHARKAEKELQTDRPWADAEPGSWRLPGVCLQRECSFSSQILTEKHKLSVPETMAEVLDVSDEEGEAFSALSGRLARSRSRRELARLGAERAVVWAPAASLESHVFTFVNIDFCHWGRRIHLSIFNWCFPFCLVSSQPGKGKGWELGHRWKYLPDRTIVSMGEGLFVLCHFLK